MKIFFNCLIYNIGCYKGIQFAFGNHKSNTFLSSRWNYFLILAVYLTYMDPHKFTSSKFSLHLCSGFPVRYLKEHQKIWKAKQIHKESFL